MHTTAQIDEIIRLLEAEYPMAECTLDFTEAYQLLVSVRLAAQCTDKRVNQISPALFARFPTVQDMAKASQEELEEYIRSTGFFRAKAKDLIGAAKKIVSDFGGRVPDRMEDLLTLPGMGRKSANLILGDVYGLPAYVVDTHCIRLTNRIGLVNTKDPVKLEMQLRKIIPPDKSSDFCHRMVYHGRAVCQARKPDCEKCVIRHLCDTYRAEHPDDTTEGTYR